jgi:hypothetical protein
MVVVLTAATTTTTTNITKTTSPSISSLSSSSRVVESVEGTTGTVIDSLNNHYTNNMNVESSNNNNNNNNNTSNNINNLNNNNILPSGISCSTMNTLSSTSSAGDTTIFGTSGTSNFATNSALTTAGSLSNNSQPTGNLNSKMEIQNSDTSSSKEVATSNINSNNNANNENSNTTSTDIGTNVVDNTNNSSLAKGVAAHNSKLLPSDYTLGDDDVICGRGSRCFNHTGNKRFRKVVESQLERYSNTLCKFDKTSIICEIVSIVRLNSPHGGFVKKDGDTGRYYEVGDFLAVRTVYTNYVFLYT